MKRSGHGNYTCVFPPRIAQRQFTLRMLHLVNMCSSHVQWRKALHVRLFSQYGHPMPSTSEEYRLQVRRSATQLRTMPGMHASWRCVVSVHCFRGQLLGLHLWPQYISIPTTLVHDCIDIIHATIAVRQHAWPDFCTMAKHPAAGPAPSACNHCPPGPQDASLH